MAFDQPPPIVITALPPPPAEEEKPTVYGPPDEQNSAPREPEGESCPQVSANEIVVCAPIDSDRYLLGPDLPTRGTAMDDFGEAIRRIKIGPVELDPDLRPRDSAGIGVRIRF